MKKLFLVIVFSLLLVGCQRKDDETQIDIYKNDITSNIHKDGNSDSQNDLIYHDYGTAIKLSSNSNLLISQLNLSLKDETGIIYAINLENSEVIKLCDYQQSQDIIFTPDSNGVYNIVAKISNGEIIDLTPKANVGTVATDTNDRFLIPLN